MSLFDLLRKVADELPGCVATSVVGKDDGLPLASVSSEHSEDAAAADAFHSDVYRVVERALDELGRDAPVEGIVLQGDEMIYVSLPVDDLYFWHVVTKSDTTLGFTQALMRRYRSQIENGIAELFRGMQ